MGKPIITMPFIIIPLSVDGIGINRVIEIRMTSLAIFMYGNNNGVYFT